jgi:orotidine-5'-phosphate decarboxylase
MAGPVEGRYLDRLGARIAATGTTLCLGVDPDPDALPRGLARDLAATERFCRLLVDHASPYASAVKFNLAFFEAWGNDGIAMLQRVRDALPRDLPVIADAKRGDIASTAARHAVALFDVLGADAVTASPYLGSEALAPLTERNDRFVYVLCRTSNPGAAEIQDLTVGAGDAAPAEPVYLRVARLARRWGERGGTVGLVVGATAPHELAQVRSVAPELAFLVPGVGAQGGDVDAVMRHGPAAAGRPASLAGGGLLVNVSRGISSALGRVGGAETGTALEAVARDWSARLAVLR